MLSNTYTPPKWLILLGITLAFSSFKLLWAPPPGLNNPEAIGAFINGKIPEKSQVGDIITTPIYVNIPWESPVVATPFPQSNNMLIIEMDGRFFTLSNNENISTRTTVLDIQSTTWYYDWNGAGTKHGGIQNAVFHPQFGLGQGKDYLYVYYLHHPNDATNAASANSGYYDRLSRFTWQNGSFNPNSELIMINQYDISRGHDGSGLTFGNDGFLYVSVGDEGSQNAAATAHTQKLDDRFRSGVWRIDVDQKGGNISHPINRQPSNANVPAGQTASYTQGYYIPNDNPWVNPNGSTLEEFYAIGLRQPFRMTLDSPTGNFWIGDVGSQQREEVDLMDAPGLNFEWNYKEGTANGFRDLPNPYIGTARPPIYDFAKNGSMAIIGGYVYRGNSIPQLYGKYIFGNNGTSEIFSLSYTTGNSNDGVELIATTLDQGSLFDGISSFGLNNDNELLVLKLGKGVTGNGKIYRLTENVSNNTPTFPSKLSQTGIFSNLNNLIPAPGVIPYDVNNPLWSAGTDKKRWVAIPNDGNINSAAEKIDYSENGSWDFPIGTVFIKHFGQPNGKKLETRLWIHGIDGKWFGTTYKWNDAGTDADLLLNGVEENITIDGETFPYLYPSVSQCKTCHTSSSGDVLGFRTHQLNKDIFYPTSGLIGNQLETFAQLGFIPNVNTTNVVTSYALGDNSKSLELRARSYFDSNCSHCHQPGGNRAIFDARYTTPLAQQALINGGLIEDLGITGGKVILAQDIDKSILYQRINSTEGCCAMPPLAKGRIDKEGVQLVANWINSIDADCANSSSVILGNTLSDGNFVDGHKPALNINKSDTYTNNTNSAKEICLVDFSFYARREGNPVTPFIVKVNGTNNFTVIAIGQTRASAVYNVGNNSFPFSNHSDDVIILQPGETIATGFMDAYPDGSGATVLSVIPAKNAVGEDAVWQTYTTNGQLPSITLGQAPGRAASVAANLARTYKFNIGIDVGEVIIPPTTIDCNNPQNLAIGKIATQSSTYANNNNGYGAANAIDGNTNGVHSFGFMTHTKPEQNAWWEIDIGDIYDLSTVKIWNRTDCCAERLSNFHLLVSDVPFNSQALSATISQSGVGDFHSPGTAGRETEINLNRNGRYLRIQLSGMNALQLAEVEIMGCKQSGVTLYADCNFGGNNISLGEGAYPNIILEGFTNDALSSLKVPTGYQVILYQNNNFGGTSITLASDDNCLINNNFNDFVSSLKIEKIDDNPPTADSQCTSGENSILINGSFEETNNPAYTTADALIEDLGSNNSGVKFIDRHPDTDFPGWFTTGGIALQQGGFSVGGTLELGQTGFLGVPAPDGEIFAEMDGNHHNQLISVTSGQLLDWELTHRGREIGNDNISVSAGPVGNLTVIANLSSPNTTWVTHTGQYQVPNGITEIQFSITPTGASNGDIDSSNLLDNVKVCPSNSTPPTGCATIALPAKIEAEDFCTQQGVQAETTGDVGGGQNIGYIQNGDWMDYQISVATAGTYQVKYRVAANGASGGVIQLQLNGTAIGNMTIPSTGGWQTYTTVTNEVNLPAGISTLRVFAQQQGWNLNWVEFGNWDDTNGPVDNETTEFCEDGTSITYGNGSIKMDGGSFYQVLDANWNEIYNCGWQCGNSKTVNDLVTGDYRIYIKDNTYQVICEKVITLSAGNGGGGDPDNDGDGVPASQDCNDNDPNLTTIDATCNDSDDNTANDIVQANCTCSGTSDNGNNGGTTVSCGEVSITYGSGTIKMVGSSAKAYFFKVNDLNNGWAQVFGCSWNCGSQQTATNLSNSNYLVTIYNDDWSEHCRKEIQMTSSSIAAPSASGRTATQLIFSAYQANRAVDLQWLSNSGYKVNMFEVEHALDGESFSSIGQFTNKKWSNKLEYHQTIDEQPEKGVNYYRVKEIYLDGHFAYTAIQSVEFGVDLDGISVFPNPVQDELFISLKPFKGQQGVLTIVNQYGQRIEQLDLAEIQEDVLKMDASTFDNGFYYLNIQVNKQKTFTEKILIHRLH